MSTKPETTFYTSVHKHLPAEVYHMKTHNPFIGGVPDVWYSGPTGDLWVEYKFIVLPKRGTTVIRPDLSGLQSDWLRERYNEGRNVAVIIGCKEGGVLATNLWWEKEMTTSWFKMQLMSRKLLANWICGKCL